MFCFQITMDIAIKEEIKTEVESDSCDESINNTFIDTNNYLQTNLHFVHCESEANIKTENYSDTETPGHQIMGNNLRDKKKECALCVMVLGKRDMPNHLLEYHKITKSVCLKRLGHDKKETPTSQAQYKIKCNHCWREFQTYTDVKKCRNSHGEFNCEFCPVKKLDSYDLLEHKRKAHDMEVEFPCKFGSCKEMKKKKTLLLQHQRRVHKVATQGDSTKNNGRIPTCDKCRQSFKSNGNLKRHMDRAKTNPTVCLEAEKDNDSSKSEDSDDEWLHMSSQQEQHLFT